MKAVVNAPYLLLAIGATLTTLHLQLVGKSGDQGQLLETSLLCWTTVWFMIWRKRHRLTFHSTPIATGIGLLCVAWILVRSLSLSSYDSFLRIAPIASGIALTLLASGFALKQYWRELIVLAFLLIPTTTLLSQIDISPLTAEFGGTLLWYSGFPVSQNGVMLNLPNAKSVEVYAGCSGLQSIWQIFSLSFLFSMLFSIGWWRSIFVTIAGVIIAFIVNGVRVALMAVLFSHDKRDAFDYWHLGNGSVIFSMIAVGLFGALCFVVLERVDADEDEVEA